MFPNIWGKSFYDILEIKAISDVEHIQGCRALISNGRPVYDQINLFLFSNLEHERIDSDHTGSAYLGNTRFHKGEVHFSQDLSIDVYDSKITTQFINNIFYVFSGRWMLETIIEVKGQGFELKFFAG